jgi:hypothetical protein
MMVGPRMKTLSCSTHCRPVKPGRVSFGKPLEAAGVEFTNGKRPGVSLQGCPYTAERVPCGLQCYLARYLVGFEFREIES